MDSKSSSDVDYSRTFQEVAPKLYFGSKTGSQNRALLEEKSIKAVVVALGDAETPHADLVSYHHACVLDNQDAATMRKVLPGAVAFIRMSVHVAARRAADTKRYALTIQVNTEQLGTTHSCTAQVASVDQARLFLPR